MRYFLPFSHLGKPNYVPNIFDDCKKDEAIVQCLEDPCLKTECPAYPDAKCRTNLCGDCKAEYLQEGKVVDCSEFSLSLISTQFL